MSLIKNIPKPLAKSVLIPLGLTAEAATNVAIYNRVFGFSRTSDLASRTTKLIISNEEMNDIMKIIKSFEESGLLIKGVNKTMQKKQKNKKADLYF